MLTFVVVQRQHEVVFHITSALLGNRKERCMYCAEYSLNTAMFGQVLNHTDVWKLSLCGAQTRVFSSCIVMEEVHAWPGQTTQALCQFNILQGPRVVVLPCCRYGWV